MNYTNETSQKLPLRKFPMQFWIYICTVVGAVLLWLAFGDLKTVLPVEVGWSFIVVGALLISGGFLLLIMSAATLVQVQGQVDGVLIAYRHFPRTMAAEEMVQVKVGWDEVEFSAPVSDDDLKYHVYIEFLKPNGGSCYFDMGDSYKTHGEAIAMSAKWLEFKRAAMGGGKTAQRRNLLMYRMYTRTGDGSLTSGCCRDFYCDYH